MGMKGEWLLGKSKTRLPGLTVCLWSFTIALRFSSHLPRNCCPEKIENPRERIAIDLRLGKKFVVRWCTVAKEDRSEIYQQSVALEIGKAVGCQLESRVRWQQAESWLRFSVPITCASALDFCLAFFSSASHSLELPFDENKTKINSILKIFLLFGENETDTKLVRLEVS